MPSWLSLGFQESCSPYMYEISFLYDYIMVIMTLVIILVSYIMIFLMFSSYYYKYLSEGTFIETIWSIIPAFLLIMLVIPSMKVLYLMEDVKIPTITVKIVGHQWYWSYIVKLFSSSSFFFEGFLQDNFFFDSMLDSFSKPRLLSCSSYLYVPLLSTVRFLISSTDVIHSFSVPSLGLKVDAFPGRVNQLFSSPSRLGLFFGQCSEICGSNHSFMPISVKVLDVNMYYSLSLDLVLDSLMGYSSLDYMAN